MDIICKNASFITCDISISQIINKYHIGRIIDNNFYINPYEAVYLYIKNKIKPLNLNGLEDIMERLFDDDVYLYYVYEILKNKGYYIKREKNKFYFKRESKEKYDLPVILIKENEVINFSDIYNELPSIFITVDEEKSVTYFYADYIDPYGCVNEEINIKNVEKINNVYYTRDNTPEWFGENFHMIKILNDFEADYITKTIKSNEDLLYNDLINRKFIVKSGFKYGQNFRVYRKSMNEHAEYLVSFIDSEEWYKISRAIRLSISVRKKTIFSGFINKEIKYIKIERLRDI